MNDVEKVKKAIKSQLEFHKIEGTSHCYNAIVLDDALKVIESQQAENERMKSTLGTVITANSITLTATGDAKQGEKRGLVFGKSYMKEHIKKELLYKHLLTDEIREIIDGIN